jgi:endonuclease YncB( thermonuclease family)
MPGSGPLRNVAESYIHAFKGCALINKFIVVGLLLIAAMPTAALADITGTATVIDGDTLEIRGTRIRLHGIDAPESGQLCQRNGKDYRCGQQAAAALDDLVARRSIRCEDRDVDQYGRTVAECFVASLSLNIELVKRGWASTPAHVTAEKAARAAKRGIWSGTFQMPAEWRQECRGQRGSNTSASSDQSRDGCKIKGNIGRSGQKIYHQPGDWDYGSTRINTRRGERWFCAEREAQDNGWKHAGE